MTNREKFKDELDAILLDRLAVKDGKPVICLKIDCKYCDFHEKGCVRRLREWIDAEYQEIDWSKIPIDTPVLASCDGKRWYRRYFAGIWNGKPNTYDLGATSWSTDDQRTCTWPFMKLAEDNG